jgi:predicted ATPase
MLNLAGDDEQAEQNYRIGMAVAERQSAKVFHLHTAIDLARLWRDQGTGTEARDLLTPVYNWFTEGFDTPVLQNAKALLEELSGMSEVRTWLGGNRHGPLCRTFRS